MKYFVRHQVVSGVALLLAGASAGPAAAQVYTWSGLGTTNVWNNPGNWQGSVVPASAAGTTIVLTGTTQTNTVMNLGGLSLNSLTFAPGAGSFSVTQSSTDFFTFLPTTGAGAVPHIDQFSAAAQTINFPNTGFQLSGDLLLGGSGAGSLSISGQLVAIGGTPRLILNGPYTVNLSTNVANTISGIIVNAGTLHVNSDIVFGGAPLTFGGGALQLTNNTTPLSRPIVLNSAGGTIDVNGFTASMTNTGLAVTGPGRLTLTNSAGNGTTIINGQLQQTGGLLVSGANHIVTLGGNNTYTGGTTVSGGAMLAFDSDTRLGNTAGGITLDAGALRLTNPGSYNTNRPITFGIGGGTIDIASSSQPVGFGGTFSGSGGLTKTGTGRIGLLAANTYTGPTTVLGGSLDVVHNQALQNTTVSLLGGTLGFFNPATAPVFGALGGTGSVNLSGINSLTVGGNNASTTWSGSFSGSVSGGLTKAGTGTWTLAGTNTQSGPLNVTGGTVLVGSSTALSSNGAITIFNNATLDLNGFRYIANPSFPVTLASGGTLRLGGGALSAASSGLVFLSGNVPMEFGTLNADPGSNVSYTGATLSNGFLSGGGLQTIGVGSGPTTFNNVTTFNGTQLTQNAGSTLNLNNSQIGGALSSNGALNWTNGSVSSSGALTISGTTNVTGFENDGSINISGGGVLSNGGSSLVSGGGSIVNVASGGVVQLNGTNFDLHGALLTNAGMINGGTLHIYFGSLAAGTGSFGAVVIHPGGAYTPGVTLSNIPAPTPTSIGVIRPLDSNQGSASPIQLAADTTATVSASDNVLTLTGPMTAPGKTLTKNGDGVLALASLRGGGLTISAGTVQILPNGGPASTTVLGALTIAGGNNAWQGRFDLTNNALVIDYATTSPLPAVQNQIKSAYAGGAWSGTGVTSSFAASAAGSAHKTALGYAEASDLGISTFRGQPVDSTALLVRYTYSGDANLDGVVDTLDFNALAGNFGGTNKLWNQADFNYDGVVDTLDFNNLAANFGQSLPTDSNSEIGTVVPEPALGGWVLSSCAAVVLRRRRRR